MIIVLENPPQGRSIRVEVTEEFVKDPENLSVLIGTERFRLVSTKTEEQKELEDLLGKFTEQVYPVMETEMVLAEDAPRCITRILNQKPWDRLREVGNMELLVSSLARGYAAWLDVSKEMSRVQDRIKETTLDPNVFFDYILRLLTIVRTAKDAKEYKDAMKEYGECAKHDERGTVGLGVILVCVLKLDKAETTIEESDRNDAVNALQELEQKWREKQKSIDVSKDKYCRYRGEQVALRNMLLDSYDEMMRAKQKDDDVQEISDTRERFRDAVGDYILRVTDLEILECVDPSSYEESWQGVCVDAQFGMLAQIIDDLSKREDGGAPVNLMSLRQWRLFDELEKNGLLDYKRLATNGYTSDEMSDLVKQYQALRQAK